MSIVALDRVRKSFGSVTAVSGLSLEIERPGVTALLGPNGAGKTTTIDMLLGLRRPDAGTVHVLGMNPASARARRYVGCTPQQSSVPDALRVSEIVRFVADQYPDPLPAEQMLSDFGLTHLADRQAGVLSGGEVRRLMLVLAFVGRPKLVVLDEPTNGLDPETRRRVWDYVRGFSGRGGTVMLTTHHMEEAEALASRIVVVDRERSYATPRRVKFDARAACDG